MLHSYCSLLPDVLFCQFFVPMETTLDSVLKTKLKLILCGKFCSRFRAEFKGYIIKTADIKSIKLNNIYPCS